MIVWCFDCLCGSVWFVFGLLVFVVRRLRSSLVDAVGLGCCACLRLVVCVGDYVVSGCLGMDCECLVLALGVCLGFRLVFVV